MKVLVVVYKFARPEEIGAKLGSFAYFYKQIQELKKQGLEVMVLAPWQGWFKKGDYEIDGIKIFRYFPKLATRSLRNFLFYKLINQFYIWRTGQKVLKIVSEEKIDLVYVRQARETGAAVARVKNKIKIPIVFQPITTWRWHFEKKDDNSFKNIIKDNKQQKKYADEILNKFDFFITYNKTMAQEYIEMGAKEDKFYIIPGAVDHELFKPMQDKMFLRKSLGLPADKKIVLYIGRINFEEKGLDYLLHSFKNLQTKISDSLLLAVGPGIVEQQQKLKALAQELNLGDSFLYAGGKPYNELVSYINSADLGVVPSVWFESSGRVSLDMLSCGLPVIVTNTGGLPEYSIDQKTGFVIEPKNIDQLSQSMFQILSDDDLRNSMSRAARENVLQNYTFEATTNRFINLFKQFTSK